jgi:TolB protein
MRFRLTVILCVLLLSTTLSAALGDQPDFPGRIAVIGDDYNVYTLSAADTAQLTTDGSRERAYQWPTWARDGRLAFFCCDLTSTSNLRTGVFISPDGMASARQVMSTIAQPIIYANWSPAACSADGACWTLSILVNDLRSNRLRVELVRDEGSEHTVREVAIGAPFYTTFSPDGQSIFMHRNNFLLEVYDIAANRSRLIEGRSSGTFQTAAWSPVDNSLLYGIAGSDQTTTLVINQDGNIRTVASGLSGLVAFVWSPDGTMIAYRTRTQRSLDPVVVVNARTGRVISTGGQDVFAFWWSPDSRKLAFLSLVRPGDAALLSRQPVQDAPNVRTRWVIMDVETGELTALSPFVPNYELAYFANYFDQFAVSHRVWSPDSRYLVYSEAVGADSNQVTLADTLTGESFRLTEGRLGVWSWN